MRRILKNYLWLTVLGSFFNHDLKELFEQYVYKDDKVNISEDETFDGFSYKKV